MGTGENEQALRKIIDMTRLISIVILALHFYFYCYGAFRAWGLTVELTDRIMINILRTGLFDRFHNSKLWALFFLCISLIGAKGRKDEKQNYKQALTYLLTGITAFFLSAFILLLTFSIATRALLYMILSGTGYLLILAGGTLLSRIIKDKIDNRDPFNRENETFPQEERLLENEYSINLPTTYQLKKETRKGWINVINPFRATLVAGTPGAGKSYFYIRHVITQHIAKGFSMFVYDFKYDDLSKIAYNTWLKYKHQYKVPPKFYVINFDDLNQSHRCNPLEPSSMLDITDAAESARTILLGLNREWIKKQGDFFIESPINFVTGIIWFLRKYQGGEYCTLPHVIELMQVDYSSLFSILRSEKEIEVLINPFVNAYLNGAMEQLEGQIASAKIAMARLSSPQLYYTLSGNDFTLDINNPNEPKIVCVGNNPKKIQTYGAVLSLYVNRLLKLVNTKGCIKSSLIFDEFPTIYLNNMDTLIATARSNLVATTLGIQDFSQLRRDYGKEMADVLINIVGNIICGQVNGDTAETLSKRFGRIMQDRTSLSINGSDTSVSKSLQLENAVPTSKIASLSSGEFVGLVADDPKCKIDLKAFHCTIQNDDEAILQQTSIYDEIPNIRNVNIAMVRENYEQIWQDVRNVVGDVLEKMKADIKLKDLIISLKN